jgi:hypothetical protein
LHTLRQLSPIAVLSALLASALSVFRSHAALHLEILALRRQLGVLHRSVRKPKLTPADRLLWAWLYELWNDWRSALVIVKPETVIAWHRKGFRLFWTWKIHHGRTGRPSVSNEVRELIRKMSRENPLWGPPRIHGELLKLGIDVGETSVGKYMVHHRRPPSQTWRTFLGKSRQDLGVGRLLHRADDPVSDPLRVPGTGSRAPPYRPFQRNHSSHRRVDRPATPGSFSVDTAPRYLLRDRDRIFGQDFVDQVKAMGIKQVLSARRSPWQRAYVERVIGTIRRECLDHVIVFNERSLYRHLQSFMGYYHRSRTHLGLQKDAPEPRSIQSAELGQVISIPEVGGLHHRYERRAA